MKKLFLLLSAALLMCTACNNKAESTAEGGDSASVQDTAAAAQPEAQEVAEEAPVENGITYVLNQVYSDRKQRTIVAEYCTKSFKRRAAQTMEMNLNLFGPDDSDFCSDGSMQVRNIHATVPEVTEEGESMTVKVPVSYDLYERDWDHDPDKFIKSEHKKGNCTFKMVKEGDKWLIDDVIWNDVSTAKRAGMMA